MTSNSGSNADLIERFLAAYNTIDHELRHRLRLDEYQSFTSVVNAYAEQYPSWGEDDRLKRYAELRNFISHSSTKPHERLAVPTLQVVEDIERIRDRNAQHVVPKFQRQVTSLQDDQSLSDVLALITKMDYSQFPVNDGKGQFKGLLTENGITRWLAHHVVKEMSLIELQDVSVMTVLVDEERRENYLFTSRETTLDEAISYFTSKPLLEALLITHNGRQSEKLLGIMTRWDVLTTS